METAAQVYPLHTLTQGSGIGITNGAGAITISNTGVTSLTGTANQITASGNTGDITLSLPQNINSGAVPTFAGLNLTNAIGQLTLGATGYTTTISSAAPATDRIATIPALSADDTFTFIGQAQTLTNKTFTDNSSLFQDDLDNTKKLAFQISNVSGSSTVTLTAPNQSGTIAVGATTPISLNATTGVISCPTCLTSSIAVTSVNNVTGAITIVGGGINGVTTNGQTITVTGTEADTLQSVTTRAATSTDT